MSDKLFSLIHGGEVHLKAGQKVIPKENFIEAQNGEELLKKVSQDALQFRQEVAVEIEDLKRAAELDGFKAGFQAWLGKIEAHELKIREVREEYKKLLIPALLKMVKKLVGKELEQKEETIVDIVMASLKAVSSHKKIVIYISPKQKNIVEKHKARLKALFEELETLTIQERQDLGPEDVVIESEKGIVNARFDNQLANIEQALSKFLSQLDKQEGHPSV